MVRMIHISNNNPHRDVADLALAARWKEVAVDLAAVAEWAATAETTTWAVAAVASTTAAVNRHMAAEETAEAMAGVAEAAATVTTGDKVSNNRWAVAVADTVRTQGAEGGDLAADENTC